MIFTTYWFIAFSALVVLAYHLIPKPSWKLGFLGAACLVFHAHFAGPAGMAPLIVMMIATYFAALSGRRGLCLAAMVLCVFALCFYKYAYFLVDLLFNGWNPELATQLRGVAFKVSPSAPPLGISFFAFEFVHYLFEVRKGGEPIRNPLKFLLFSIFFPSLVAGPIKRYRQFIPTLEESSRVFHLDNIGEGVFRIATGYVKKVVIADNLNLYVDAYQPDFASMGILSRWILLGAIGARILLDFSGYSDIAIGVARLLGITLPENFNWPYLARNLQDFWQRWHISLTLWIRDYIYIPLGGNRYGISRRIFNGLVAFALCGLWHGPDWHFVIWGLYHGVGLGVCSSYVRIPVLGELLHKNIFAREPLVGFVLTQVYVLLGWLLFFYPVHDALAMARLLFGQ